MTKRGRMEARIYQPSNWTATLAITGLPGTATITVAASSTRYHTDLLAAFETAIEAAEVTLGGANGFTITSSVGESGTGKVEIDLDGATNFAITWVSTDLRDLLGYTGNLSGASVYTATNHAQGVWLPDCPYAARYGPNDAGHTEADLVQTVSPQGHVQTSVYNTRTHNPSVRWSHVSRARARIQGETVTGESFERFIRYTQFGELAYFRAGEPIRLIWDADTSSTYTTYVMTGRSSTEMERAVEEWAGLWPIEIAGYVVPS
jgi:hypothetical protein